MDTVKCLLQYDIMLFKERLTTSLLKSKVLSIVGHCLHEQSVWGKERKMEKRNKEKKIMKHKGLLIIFIWERIKSENYL